MSLLLSMVLVASVFALAPPAQAAGFTINPSSLNFGNVGVGVTSPTQQFTLTNDNLVNMNITSVVLSGASGQYTMTENCSPVVAPDDSCQVDVTFLPTTVGTHNAEVVVTHDASPNPDVLGVTGVGLAGDLQADVPGPVDFGSVPITGGTSLQSIQFNNNGPGDVELYDIELVGGHAGNWAMAGPCIPPLTIAQGGFCDLDLTFDPAAVGDKTATLRIISNDPSSPLLIDLLGKGLADPVGDLSYSLSPVAFGGKGVNSGPTNKVLDIKNVGTASTTVTGVSIQGGDTTQFAVTSTCGLLAPGATCQETVTYTPTLIGNVASQIRVSSTLADSPDFIDVTGEGLRGHLVANSTSVDFGQLPIGAAALTENIQVTNEGPGRVTIASREITGENAHFTQGGTCVAAGVLNVGDSCTLVPGFDPSTVGAKSATYRLVSNADNSPLEIPLDGFGVADPLGDLSYSLSPVAFGGKGINSGAHLKTLDIENSGTAPLTIAGVSIQGGDTTQFAVTSTCGLLAPGATCQETVTYTPTIIGDVASQIRVVSTLPDSPEFVDVTGTGLRGHLVANPSAVDFGQLPTNATAVTENIQVTNEGPGRVTIASRELTGDNTHFTQAGTCAAATVLNVGDSCTLVPGFDPSTIGAKAATFKLVSNADNTPLEIPLDGEGIAANAPGISFTPNPLLDFGNLGVNTIDNKMVIVKNTGNMDLNVLAASIVGGDSTMFTLLPASNCVGGTFPPDSECQFTVQFNPTAVGDFTSQLRVASDAPGSPHFVELHGTASGPVLDLSPTSHDFGGLAIGDTSAGQLITATNTGDAPLTFTAAPALGGANPGQFLITGDTCLTSTLQPGESCTLQTQFIPTGLGNLASQIDFTSDAASSPDTVQLAGFGLMGRAGELSVSDVDFGTVPIGEVSDPKTVLFTNTGTTDVTVSALAAIAGGDSADFLFISNGCFALRVLAPGESCAAIMEFVPSLEGVESSSYSVTSDAPGSPHTASLKGTGAPAKAPLIDLSPASIDFGTVPNGTQSIAELVTATNVGTAPLNITGIALDGPNPGQFATFNDNCTGASLDPGSSCTVLARYVPTGLGIADAQIDFSSNANGSPHVVSLHGIGGPALAPIATFDVTDLDFGPQQINTTSAAKSIKLTNTGTADLVLNAVPTIAGVNAGQYNLTGDTCGTSTLIPGESCTVQVWFAPTAVGPQIAQMEYDTNAPGSVHAIPLAGLGIDNKAAELSPDLDFGLVAVGPKSPSQTMSFTNTGTSPVTVGAGGATIVGGDATDFVIDTNGCFAGRVLAPGTGCDMDIYFDPAALGSKNAIVLVPSDAVGQPHMATVKGLAVQGKLLDVSPSLLEFGNEGIGGMSAAKSVTLTNVGDDDVTLGALTLAGFNSGNFQLDVGTCVAGVLAPGESCQANILFAPLAPVGPKSATLEVNSDALGSPQVVTMTGNSTLSKLLEIVPASHDFGDLASGLTSPSKLFTVTNVGDDPVTLSSDADLFDGDTGDFDIPVNGCLSGLVLDPGESCVSAVAFVPTANGPRNSAFRVQSDATGSPHLAPLAGNGVTGPAALVDPPSWDFGDIGVGVPSVAKTFTLTNTGTSDLTNTAVALMGVDAADFVTSVDTCTGAVLPVGAHCTVIVFADPATTGLKTASLQFTNDAPGSPHVVPLLANVVDGAAALIDPTSIDFGDQGVNTESVAKTITLTNVGTQDLTLSATAGLIGPGAAHFVEGANTCTTGLVIVPLGSCSYTVSFLPTSVGPKNASVRFDNNAPGSPQTVPLTGNGVIGGLQLLPGALVNFGQQGVGTTSAGKVVTLRNNGVAPVTLDALNPLALLGDGGDFIINGNTCTALVILVPGGECQMVIQFAPTVTGSRSAILQIPHDAMSSPTMLVLQGVGIDGAVALLAPDDLKFGPQAVGTQSPGKKVTITNIGTAPLNLAMSPVISGVNAGEFQMATDSCTSGLLIVLPGGSCEVTITYNPTQVGPASAALDFFDNAVGSPQVATLSGIGVIGAIEDFSPANVEFGKHGLGRQARGRLVTLTNVGDWPMLIQKKPKLKGRHKNSFTLSANTCTAGKILMPDAECSVRATFTPPNQSAFAPEKKGLKSAHIAFFTDASGSQHAVSLTGQAVRQKLKISHKELEFDPRPEGTKSFAKQVKFKNVGNSLLHVLAGPKLVGVDKESFMKTANTCYAGRILEPGSSCAVSILFRPQGPGAKSAALKIKTDSPRRYSIIKMNGWGIGDGDLT